LKPRVAFESTLLLASSALALLTLTGCPLSDDYSVDPNYGMGGGSSASGGMAIAQGGASFAGAPGSGGGGTSSGGESSGVGGSDVACSETSCAGACCDNGCVDLSHDAANCGRCGNACSVGRSCDAGSCETGWVPIAAPPADFVAREKAAYTTFAGKVFVWGGIDATGTELRTGAIYDAALDTWQSIHIDKQTPSARELATAVWTGSAVLVFGGRNGGGDVALRDAALYDPIADRWTKAVDSPTARVAPLAAAYGDLVVSWSGLSATLIPLGGADRYRASMDSWAPAMTMNGPPRLGHTACAAAGGFFYVYGGIDTMLTATDKAYRYNFAMNNWVTLEHGPGPRFDAFGASDGTRFYVWGGRDSSMVMRTGSSYDAQWAPLGTQGAPVARYAPLRESGWSFDLEENGFAVLGGFDANGEMLHDGGIYSRASDAWTKIPAWSSDEDHGFGVSVHAGSEVVVFGGRTGDSLTNNGERYSL
jgi:hypothetical protein